MSFGNDLRQQRECRGVSLAQVAEATRVPANHLQALEEGEIKNLPGGVFNRGILQSYCRFLGLEESPWIERYNREFSPREEDWTEFASAVKRNRITPTASSGSRWLGVLLMLLTILALAWAVWHFLLRPRIVHPRNDAENAASLSLR